MISKNFKFKMLKSCFKQFKILKLSKELGILIKKEFINLILVSKIPTLNTGYKGEFNVIALKSKLEYFWQTTSLRAFHDNYLEQNRPHWL